FPPGRKLRWDRAALPRLLQVIKEVDPALEVQWANRDSVSFKVPDAGRSWAHLRTKDSDSLKARFLGKKGQFNLAQVDGLAASATISGHRDEGDVLELVFTSLDQIQPARLKALLAEHLRGFREVMSGRAAKKESA